MVNEGDKLKNQQVQITDESKLKLAELVGKKGMVLYFYPRDNTPGCTTEACDFRDSLSKLKRRGYSVVGVSGDSIQSHQRFTEKQTLNFPLIADHDFKLSAALGIYGEKKLYGKTHMGIIRTTLVLDPNLKVLKVYPRVRVKEHVDQILADLKDLA